MRFRFQQIRLELDSRISPNPVPEAPGGVGFSCEPRNQAFPQVVSNHPKTCQRRIPWMP